SSRLNCSPQTSIRLMREIEAVVGDSLEFGRDGHRRWYRFKPKQSNRLGLNFAELDFLSVYRDLAAPFLSSEDRERIDTSLFNFSMLLADPSYQAGTTRGAKAQFVFTSKGRIDYTGHYETLERLAKALRNSLICLVRYKKAGAAEEREHCFAPGRIVSMNGALYVLGATVTNDFHCIRHLISLAVHRIREVTVTDKHFLFEMPEEDLGMFGLPWHEPRNFRIRFAPGGAADYVRERIWSDQQRIVEQEDGGVVLELVSRSEPEVTSWVRSFGKEAELLDKDGDEQEPIANYAQPGGTFVPDFASMAGKGAMDKAKQDGQNGEENSSPDAAPEDGSEAGSKTAPDDAKAAVQPWKRLHRPAMRRKAMARTRNA
ncbi:MAG: WYL domain-containing protein, partial [Desulfovibrio sp.]|nr:WYL domain-containing protein [Desulfovibrio sp.]